MHGLHSKEELGALVTKDRDLFADYWRRIQEVLRKEGGEQKTALAALVSSLEGTSIRIALIGANRTGLRSTLFDLREQNRMRTASPASQP